VEVGSTPADPAITATQAAADPAGQTASSETPAETEQSGSSGQDSGSSAHAPSKSELEGKWFALYGGLGQGAKTYTFEDGHQIEFLASGAAIWSLTGNGGNNQLTSMWDMNSGEIKLTIDKPDQLNGDYKQTPLAFGRDDEVGLTGAQNETPRVVFRFKPSLDNEFLALVGKNGELMVYGKVDNGAAASAPDVSGKWKLTPAPGQVYDADVKSTGDGINVTWGPYHSDFTGTWTHGYFVGPVTSSGNLAYAAVAPTPGGTLDGVISTDPFNEMSSTFDFTRAAQ
jgi:hypothetical protein